MTENQVVPNISMDVVEKQKEIINTKVEKPTKVFDTKNYFDTKLKEGINEKEITFRLLPINDDNSPFKSVHMHSVKVPKEISASGRKSYICLERTEGLDPKWGKKCPFCELNREAYKLANEAQTTAEKEKYEDVRNANMAQENWIIRAIDRENESDGVKFWMFGASRKKSGLYDTMMSIYETRKKESIAEQKEDPTFEIENIFDLYKGRDLKLKITKGSERQSYTIIDTGRQKPLSKDNDLIIKWCYDPKKWYEVFTPKSYDYMKIILEGGIPWFDRITNTWVTKEENNKTIETVNQENAQAVATAEAKYANVTPTPSTNTVDNSVSTPPTPVVNNDPEELPF